MASTTYPSSPLPAPAPWFRVDPSLRKKVVYALWGITEIGLIAGLFDTRAYGFVVGFTALHALAFLALLRFRPMAFPAQLRLAYLLWVAVGTYVPGARFLMYITTIGAGAFLVSGYCPLVRLLYLLPWNRDHGLNLRTFVRVFTTAPTPGRFRIAPAR